MTPPNQQSIREFKSAKAFESWLEKNHEQPEGIWLKIAKKDSGEKSVSYAEALDIALCYGWIDGRKNALDEKFFLQWFCMRRTKSIWSKINIAHTERLIREGRMKAAGLKAIEKAKADGSWEKAYDSPGNMQIPEDFLKALRKNKKAEAYFNTLNKSKLFAIGFRLQTAKKPETREKRMLEILDKLAREDFS